MTAFLWATIALLSIDTLCKLVMLGNGFVLPRTRGGMAIDAAIAIVMIAWAAVLLFR